MHIREATIEDIGSLHQVRMSVTENRLSNPLLVTKEDYTKYLTDAGKGWLCMKHGFTAGFAILDTTKNNVWALFVHPGQEGKGIGKVLQQTMLDWFFNQTQDHLWLSTSPGTRAEIFYRKSGWRETGRAKNGEIIFEMDYASWKNKVSTLL